MITLKNNVGLPAEAGIIHNGAAHMNPLQIAIDGPVAAGKGDIASRLAQELNLAFINTGAMYRSVALYCTRNEIPLTNGIAVIKSLTSIEIDLLPGNKDRPTTVILNGEDVTDYLKTKQMDEGSSRVATISEVRAYLVARQQKIVEGKAVVMEGRDIGKRVLPNAQLKIFLTASPEERAHRRLLDWKKKGIEKTYEETLAETLARDKQDMGRVADPLEILPDAWVLDTTGKTQEQVVEEIKQELKKRNFI